MINDKYLTLDNYQDTFRSAKPFPYLVLDDFFQKDFFQALNAEIKSRKTAIKGRSFNSAAEKNKIINLNNNLPVTIQRILDTLTEVFWVQNLVRLSGIADLVADDGHNEVLSNFHEMSKSGFLGSHVDHSQHPKSLKKHVLNILVYLSEDWISEYGGNTLLYNKNGTKVEKLIEYVPNRLIIFLHTPYSFHGVDELKPPNHQVRRTLYLDFYSEIDNPYSHLKLPFKNHFFEHDTTFILKNKLSYFKLKNFLYTKSLAKYKLRKWKSIKKLD